MMLSNLLAGNFILLPVMYYMHIVYSALTTLTATENLERRVAEIERRIYDTKLETDGFAQQVVVAKAAMLQQPQKP